MFRARRAGRIAPGVRAARSAPGGAVEPIVHDAEALVSRAWAVELLRRCDRMAFTVRASYEDCDTAHRALMQAQRDGDSGRIAAAHAALAQALDAADTCAAASEKIRSTLCAELELLARTTREQSIEHLVRDLHRDRPPLTLLWTGLAVREGWLPDEPPSPWARLAGRLGARWFVLRWNLSCRVGTSRLCRMSAGAPG